MKSKNILIFGAMGAGVVLLVWFAIYWQRRPAALDGFAACLKEKETVFYGAFWCPNCQSQKEKFGRSARFLPYIECSTPDGNGQKTECTEKGISGYPTWVFADDTVEVGDVSLDILSEKSGCELPS